MEERLICNSVQDDDHQYLGTACWVFIGYRDKAGYGHITIRSPLRANPFKQWAHRVAWVVFRCEEIPPGYQLDHLCNYESCINPGHMEPVTKAENIRRRDERRAA
jgi:hypothetical protein